MIRLDNVSKQVGHQILFIEASAALQKGEKIGLVGPNGAGKTTLFRMISGQEPPDEGQVSLDRGISIGYFSQDVGEMSGRSAVAPLYGGSPQAWDRKSTENAWVSVSIIVDRRVTHRCTGADSHQRGCRASRIRG